MTHHRLECQKRITRKGVSYPCPGLLGMFWGGVMKVRMVDRGEEARDGYDSLSCPKCGQKWEVDRSENRAAA